MNCPFQKDCKPLVALSIHFTYSCSHERESLKHTMSNSAFLERYRDTYRGIARAESVHEVGRVRGEDEVVVSGVVQHRKSCSRAIGVNPRGSEAVAAVDGPHVRLNFLLDAGCTGERVVSGDRRAARLCKTKKYEVTKAGSKQETHPARHRRGMRSCSCCRRCSGWYRCWRSR